MDREQKLGLIIGFALLLVVGVLVSDHFSLARDAQLSGDLEAASASQVGAGTPGLLAGPMAKMANPIGEERTHAPPPAKRDDERRAEREAKANDTPVTFGPTGRVLEDPADVLSRPRVPPRKPGSTQKPAPRIAEAPQTMRYTVKKNESLSEISQRLLGTAKAWRKIRDANPGVISEDGGVRWGAVIEIPVEGVSGTGRRADARTYLVQKDDTLRSIADELLGNADAWRRIAEANTDVLPDPDDLTVGMTLVIPGA